MRHDEISPGQSTVRANATPTLNSTSYQPNQVISEEIDPRYTFEGHENVLLLDLLSISSSETCSCPQDSTNSNKAVAIIQRISNSQTLFLTADHIHSARPLNAKEISRFFRVPSWRGHRRYHRATGVEKAEWKSDLANTNLAIARPAMLHFHTPN